MTIEQVALIVIRACESVGVAHMVTGAFAYNYYGIPRSTKDFDVVVDVSERKAIPDIIRLLEHDIDFGAQVQFDTLTWGRRHIGRAKHGPVFQGKSCHRHDQPLLAPPSWPASVRFPSPRTATMP